MKRTLIDLTGQHFTRWTVLGESERRGPAQRRWLCRCECGTEKIIDQGNLIRGKSRSCGCYLSEWTTTKNKIPGQIHLERRRRSVIVCERCGKEFEVRRYRTVGKTVRFCSRECQNFRTDDDIRTRFWENVAKLGPEECWLWRGDSFKTRYGQFSPSHNTVRSAHRQAWEYANGPIPDGLQVCHRCDVRNCCNPAHLFLGTAHDNMADASSKGRIAFGNRHGSKTHPESILKGSRHPMSKLTETDVVEMRRLSLQGVTIKDIAATYHMSLSPVYAAIAGKTWRHVK